MVFCIPHIAYMVIESGQVSPLTFLFFTDPTIRTALDETLRHLCEDPTKIAGLVKWDVLPATLAVVEEQEDPLVNELAAFMCGRLALAMVSAAKTKTIVDLLGHHEYSLQLASARAIQQIAASLDHQIGLMTTDTFLPRVYAAFMSDEDELYAILCQAITDLTTRNAPHAVHIISAGLSTPLVQLAVHPRSHDIQIPALMTLETLSANHPVDKRGLISAGILPAMAGIINNPPSSQVRLIATRIIENLVTLGPEHRSEVAYAGLMQSMALCLANQDPEVLTSALNTCVYMAGNADPERKAIIDAKIVDVLPTCIRHHSSRIAILACQVVENLAKTGTFRQQLIDSGIRRPLDKVCSSFIKTKLSEGEDKKSVHKAAQAALDAIGKKFSERLTRAPPKKTLDPNALVIDTNSLPAFTVNRSFSVVSATSQRSLQPRNTLPVRRPHVTHTRSSTTGALSSPPLSAPPMMPPAYNEY
jgi:hypothetical protein